MFFRTAFVVLPFVLGAVAQSSNSSESATLSANLSSNSTVTTSAAIATPSLSACNIQCLTQAENSTTCQSYTDFMCTCTDTAFQVAVESCLTAGCPEELSSAKQREETRCSALNITVTRLE
ncbi:hypothetical protein SCHPADRAFT_941248 [Schizopora paradoxa]|uniref:CFEM domain-containing protein n=1 Tax=Schizopora paradoxa TaxID=27342 RepID=A0A0H2RKQ5_9AGAM|nr:hypothetical protein SCHPADRAFT_941248 [Schizopora paradoxa]